MVCHDVMSLDCLLSVNLLLLKSVLTIQHNLFEQRQSDSGAGHDAFSSPLLHLNASGLRKHACPKTERATCTGSQCCACVEADDWHTKTAPKDKTDEKVSLPPSRSRLRSHTPAHSYTVSALCCTTAVLRWCCATLHHRA